MTTYDNSQDWLIFSRCGMQEEWQQHSLTVRATVADTDSDAIRVWLRHMGRFPLEQLTAIRVCNYSPDNSGNFSFVPDSHYYRADKNSR